MAKENNLFNKIHAFIFDMDGTLLNDKNQISESNLNAINFLHLNNKKVIIATGRPNYMNHQYYDALNLKDAIIGINGAMVDLNWRNLNQTKVMGYLSKESFKKIASYLNENKIDFLTYHKNSMYGFNYNNPPWFENRIYPKIQSDNKYKWNYKEIALEKLYDFLEKKPGEFVFLKILVISQKQSEQTLLKLKEFLNKFNDLYYLKSQSDVIDIMPLNISKGQTLLDISKDINLSLENALAIGDQENDIEMLKNVAYPVAMLNAKKELKKIAWKVTNLDNNNSGIADFIYSLTNVTFEEKIKKYKLNVMDNGWWYQPSIWTMSLTKWAYRPFKNYQDFLKYIKKTNDPIYLSLNGDYQFKVFNQIQKYYNNNLRLDYKSLLNKREIYLKLTDEIYIYLNQKTLKQIQIGKVFGFPSIYFETKVKELNYKIDKNLVYVFKYKKFSFELQIMDKNLIKNK